MLSVVSGVSPYSNLPSLSDMLSLVAEGSELVSVDILVSSVGLMVYFVVESGSSLLRRPLSFLEMLSSSTIGSSFERVTVSALLGAGASVPLVCAEFGVSLDFLVSMRNLLYFIFIYG